MDSHETLYRKYRPNSFAGILGQDSITTILRSQISNNQVSHAYLFCGPRGTGKTSTARIFAKAVNCLNWEAQTDVCNECLSCKMFTNQEMVDFVEIDAASNRGIDEIRRIKEAVNFLPLKSKYKVYVVDEVHMLTKDAFNSFLKTLEEAPPHVLFILATTEPHKIPETVASRVQRYDFNLVDRDTLAHKLSDIASREGASLPQEVLEVIYQTSGGSFRDAETLLAKILPVIAAAGTNTVDQVLQVLGLPAPQQVALLIESIENKNWPGFFSCYDQLAKQGIDPVVLANQLMRQLENCLTTKSATKGKFDLLNSLANRYSDIKYGYDPRKVLEIVLLAAGGYSEILANDHGSANNPPKPAPSKATTEGGPLAGIKHKITESKAELEGRKNMVEVDDKLEVPLNPAGHYQYEKIVASLLVEYPRLGAVLRNCSAPLFNEKMIQLTTNFIINYEVIKKPTSKQLIAATVTKVYPEIKNIKVLCTHSDEPTETLTVKLTEQLTQSPDLGSRAGNLSNKSLVENILVG